VAGGSLERAVRAAVRKGLGGVRAQGRDVAAVALAVRLARELDGHDECGACGRGVDAGDVGKLGPQLLAALEALALTPRARAAQAGAGSGGGPAPAGDPVADELDALRREHRGRGA
jgi:hypothetical protein